MNNTNRVVRVPFNLHRNNPSHEEVYKILEKAENKNAYIREAILFYHKHGNHIFWSDEEVVENIRSAYGDCPVSFTTDCICGFPGETQADFEESCEFLKKIGFLKVHVFPYSRRSGTPAYDFPEQVHEREKQERSRVMNGIAEEVRREVLAAYVGTEDDVLLETPLSGTLFTGYTRLYIPVVVSAPGHESGQIVHVRLGEYDGERVRAALC